MRNHYENKKSLPTPLLIVKRNTATVEQKSKLYQRYLTLLFHDLCAKTNGLIKKEVDEYTFFKVTRYL